MNHTFQPDINYFSLPYFTFLRKCVAIRNTLIAMGDPNLEVKIRNLPMGSDHYYICYAFTAHVQAIKVERNEAGEIVAVHDRFLQQKFEEEVDTFIDVTSNPKMDIDPFDLSYPIAEPKPLDIYPYEDEKIGFKGTEGHFKKAVDIALALNGLENDEGKILLDYEWIGLWLNRHKTMYWSMQQGWNMKTFSRFQLQYRHLLKLHAEMDHFPEVVSALKSHKLTEEWYQRYENLGNQKFWSSHWDYELISDQPFLIKMIDREFYLMGEPFQSIYRFSQQFEHARSHFEKGRFF